ncbi:SHOCT domain-containing protein [Streptomyces albipurpureus]|uniref:SHOCT domain-containing protein n=1 Tax=Streptomyces albipurpureus TaxID=2897419 RepID=A0ABT0UQ27_9ACTN|nr:SHOCT domain-containing protein [Streptomyces sp. CWNU-1]MCM2390724.1 SHOCT domain-containing protein [Streptomyces sp. CWNU-1]
MNTLAYGPGPGPWILLMPLIWAAVIIGLLTVLRRTGVWRTAGRHPGVGGRGPWQSRGGQPRREARGENSPIAVLGHRFARGEIDEDEYWRRLSVLDEQFGRPIRDGDA